MRHRVLELAGRASSRHGLRWMFEMRGSLKSGEQNAPRAKTKLKLPVLAVGSEELARLPGLRDLVSPRAGIALAVTSWSPRRSRRCSRGRPRNGESPAGRS